MVALDCCFGIYFCRYYHPLLLSGKKKCHLGIDKRPKKAYLYAVL